VIVLQLLKFGHEFLNVSFTISHGFTPW
jgi:hypothetical protein